MIVVGIRRVCGRAREGMIGGRIDVLGRMPVNLDDDIVHIIVRDPSSYMLAADGGIGRAWG